MDLFYIPYQDFNQFFLIFIRVSVILFILPFFNSKIIPVMSKVGLTMIITMIIYPVIDVQAVEFSKTFLGMVRLIAGELIVGITLGLITHVFFEAVKMMGSLVGFQTGFSITNILDPQNGTQVSILSNMAYLTAVTLFLVLDGHHILLKGLMESFEIIDIGTLNLNGRILQDVVDHFGNIFVLGLKIGAPAIAMLLFVKAVFGLITKLIPQIHIMIVAFPLQIVIGLLFFGLSLRFLLIFLERYLGNLEALLVHTMERISA